MPERIHMLLPVTLIVKVVVRLAVGGMSGDMPALILGLYAVLTAPEARHGEVHPVEYSSFHGHLLFGNSVSVVVSMPNISWSSLLIMFCDGIVGVKSRAHLHSVDGTTPVSATIALLRALASFCDSSRRNSSPNVILLLSFFFISLHHLTDVYKCIQVCMYHSVHLFVMILNYFFSRSTCIILSFSSRRRSRYSTFCWHTASSELPITCVLCAELSPIF